MKADDFAARWDSALPYERYVASGTPEQQRRWNQVYDAARLSDAQRRFVESFTRRVNLLVISGIWCGDCVQQCPLLQRIAQASAGKINLAFIDRDENRDLVEQHRINGGDRVPVVFFLAEDFEPCAVYGDRTLSRYRAMAAKQLGAACPVGIAAPDADEMRATLADWLNEIERIQLMLRLSSRLRQKHGD